MTYTESAPQPYRRDMTDPNGPRSGYETELFSTVNGALWIARNDGPESILAAGSTAQICELTIPCPIACMLQIDATTTGVGGAALMAYSYDLVIDTDTYPSADQIMTGGTQTPNCIHEAIQVTAGIHTVSLTLNADPATNTDYWYTRLRVRRGLIPATQG